MTDPASPCGRWPWRVAFWVALVHLGMIAFALAIGGAGPTLAGLQLSTFPARQLGFIPATAMWLVVNIELLLSGALVADALAIIAIRRMLRRPGHSRLLVTSLCLASLLGIAATAAGLIVVGRRFTFTSQAQDPTLSALSPYVGGRTTVVSVSFANLTRPAVITAAVVLVLPALWIVFAWMWKGLPRAAEPGLCPVCGYDLRASSVRCPECGAAVPGSAS